MSQRPTTPAARQVSLFRICDYPPDFQERANRHPARALRTALCVYRGGPGIVIRMRTPKPILRCSSAETLDGGGLVTHRVHSLFGEKLAIFIRRPFVSTL